AVPAAGRKAVPEVFAGGGSGTAAVPGSLRMPGQTAPAHPVWFGAPPGGLTAPGWRRFPLESHGWYCKWHSPWEGIPRRRCLLQNPAGDTIAARPVAGVHIRPPGQARSEAYTGPSPAVPGYGPPPVPRG